MRRKDVVAAITDALIPYLDEMEGRYRAAVESSPDAEATLPRTVDFKVNVEGIVAELVKRHPDKIKRDDGQHFHNKAELRDRVNDSAALMGLAPIGARALNPAEKATATKISKLAASEKRASEDAVSLRRQVEELTVQIDELKGMLSIMTRRRDRYRETLQAIYETADLPNAVVEEVLRSNG